MVDNSVEGCFSYFDELQYLYYLLDKIVQINIKMWHYYYFSEMHSGLCGRDRMIVGFINTYAISAYHHRSCKFKPRSWQGVLDTT